MKFLERIKGLIENENVEDIIYDEFNKILIIYDRFKGYYEIPLSLSEDEIDEIKKFFKEKIKSISVGENLRISFIAPPITRGLVINVRKFTTLPISPIELINFGTVDENLLAYLWIFVEGLNRKPANILIAGESGSGKTSLLNSLTAFIRKNERIVSIEDVREIKIFQANWVPLETKVKNIEELTKIILRIRPDRLIFGEIRSKEDAEFFFSLLNTGLNGCFATFHALNSFEVINRLINEPININPGLIRNLDLIIVMRRISNKKIIFEVSEIGSFEYGRPTINNLFYYKDGNFIFSNVKILFFEKLVRNFSLNYQEIEKELINRKNFLTNLKENNITKFPDVLKEIERYYNYG